MLDGLGAVFVGRVEGFLRRGVGSYRRVEDYRFLARVEVGGLGEVLNLFIKICRLRLCSCCSCVAREGRGTATLEEGLSLCLKLFASFFDIFIRFSKFSARFSRSKSVSFVLP